MKELLLRGRCEGGLYFISPSASKEVFHSAKASQEQWHYCLSHASPQDIQHVLQHNSLSLSLDHNKTICDACQQAKSNQLPYSLSNNVVSTPLELVFSDVWGPARTSVNVNICYVSFIDDYSRFTWLYLLKSKADVLSVFLQFQAHVECMLSTKILTMQTDWSGEYQKLHVFFQKIGISHRVSCPYTSTKWWCRTEASTRCRNWSISSCSFLCSTSVLGRSLFHGMFPHQSSSQPNY